jgi:hypothetical protein
MTWVTVFTSLFFLLFLTTLVSWFVFYLQFCYSVEKRWATKVLNLLHDADRCVHSENRQLRQWRTEREAKAQSLREKAFAAHLCDYSVDELEAYPGIGPGTISKLRGAGFVNLAALHRAHIRVHGLGEKRLADINYAIRDLLRKAQSTFDRGGCRQTQALADQLKTLSAHYDRLEVQTRTRARAAEEFINRLGKTVEYARAVTFWRWFRPISNQALIPSEVKEVPLADLETALRAAEQRIVRSGTAKRSPMPIEAVPAIPISPPVQAVSYGQKPKQPAPIGPNSEPEMPAETHLVLMELTIQFAFGVARADIPVTRTERELILQHVRKRFSYNRALLNRAETLCAHYETAAIDWERCLGEINRRFTPDHRTALMDFASQIVAVSCKETSRAAPFLNDLAQRLGRPPAPPTPPLPPSPPDPTGLTCDECLKLLEIRAGTPFSTDLVRRQWNLLSERFAPEKVASMGAEFVEQVQTKLAALRRAAELLLEAKGEKLETKPPTPPTQDLRHNPDLDDVFGGM